jgi:hypothetical protein
MSRRAGAGKALRSLRDDPNHLTGFGFLSIYTIICLYVYFVNKYRCATDLLRSEGTRPSQICL